MASCRGNDYFERTRELVKEKVCVSLLKHSSIELLYFQKDKFILIKFLFEECMVNVWYIVVIE